jgi:hypothetical protein
MVNQIAIRPLDGIVTTTAATVVIAAFIVAIGIGQAMADRCYTANGREVRCPPDTPPPRYPGNANRELGPNRPPALLRSQSKLIPYSTLVKEPKGYIGTNLTFLGRVDEIIENGSDLVLRVNMWSNESGQWSDAIYVNYHKDSKFEPRVLANELVEVRGDFVGMQPYTASLGATIQVPHIIAGTARSAP